MKKDMKEKEFLPLNEIKGGLDKVDAYDPFSWYEEMRKNLEFINSLRYAYNQIINNF